MTETEYINGAAGPLAIHHLGGTGDQTLVVCHATGFLGRVYEAFARELHNDMTVVAFDFRGHGDSAHPADEEGYNWQGMADDVAAVIAHIGADVLHGFGHSMGGAALLEVERRHPGTFRTAMVVEPIVPPGRFAGDSPMAAAARGRLRTFPTHADALQRYASKPPLGLFRADVLNDYVRYGFAETDDGVTLKCTPESEANTFLNAGSITLGSLAEIELDVRVAVSGDGQLPAQLAHKVVEALPNGQLLEFPDLTHFGPLQDPVTIANALRELVSAAM